MYTNLSSNEGIPFRYAYHRPGAPPAYWARPGPTPERSDDGNVKAVAAAVGGLGLLGFARIGGQRVWDRYLSGIEKLEAASPARFLRTFRYSEVLSPLGTNHLGSHAGFDISSDFLRSNTARKFMAANLGMGMAELEATGAFYKGLRFDRTGSVFGQISVKGTGQVLSNSAIPMKAGGGSEFVNWWARVTKQKVPASGNIYHSDIPEMIAVSGRPLKTDKILGVPINETAQRYLNKASTVLTHQRAYWAGQTGRLNKLLQAPAEIFNWVPGVEWLGKKLSVKPGTTTSMIGRYAGKGMALFAAFTGISYLSHLRRQSDSRVASGLVGAGIGAAAGGLFARTPVGMAIGAIAGGILGGAPRFDRGIWQGFGSMYEDVTIAHARLSQAVGLTQAKMRQEQLMPGVTKPRTLFGLAGFGAVAGGMAGYATKMSQFFRHGTDETLNRLAALEEKTTGVLGKFVGKGSGASAVERLMMRGGRMGMLAGAGLFAGFAGAAAIATGSLPGIFGASKSPEELRAIYSGEQLVPVRSGRYWEFGRSPWEGGRIKYYRPHLLALSKTHAEDIGLYGSEEEKWAQNPIIHPLKALFSDEFKYKWERQHMKDRPYPVTARFGSDIPFIGPAFAATIGKLIKPPKLIRPEEWLGTEGSTLQIPTGGSNEPVGGQGLQPGSPVSPTEIKQAVGEQIYRYNEMRGLTGFIHSAIKEKLTGSQDYYDQTARLESAERATGVERAYWQQQLGGMASLSEPLRRFIPHRRRQIELYNPIRNQMPSWMPGQNYFKDFRHGDPYNKVDYGDVRLPGKGYAALNPDVAGLSPSEYPLFHRFKILADVAMWSDEFKQTKRQMRSAIKRGELTQDQIAAFERINHQVSQKKKRRRFQQYQFESDALKQLNVKIKEEVGPGLYRTERHGMISLAGIDMSALAGDEISASNAAKKAQRSNRRKQAIVSDYLREHIYPGAELDIYVHRDQLHRYKRGKEGYYQPAVMEANGLNIGRSLMKKGLAEPTTDMFGTYTKYGSVQRTLGKAWESVAHMDSPIEYLTPASPLSKFVRQRTATEEYERVRAYGTESSFWQHPYSNFIRPTGTMMRHAAGSDELPTVVKRRNAIEEYFDKLKWVKYKSLERAAKAQGTPEDVKEMRAEQRRTLIGVNPYGSRSYVYSAMPSLDRDYYEDFAEAASPAERGKILKMLPKNQHSLYIAKWADKLATSLRAKRDMGSLSGEEEQQLKNLSALRYSEGRQITPQLRAQYNQEAPGGMSYADWSRWKEVEDYFSTRPMPKFNSPVWSPAYDLEDLKLKMVHNEGMDMHQFNLWQSRESQMPRKPYIEDPEAFNQQDHSVMARAVEKTLRDSLNMSRVRVRTVQTAGPGGLELDIEDSRKNVIDKYKNNPDFAALM